MSRPAAGPSAIETATGIRLPVLPEDWRVSDVQVFPSRHGTGVEITAQAAGLGEVSLFATHRRGSGPATEIAGAADGTAVTWNGEHCAYALSGSRDEAALRRAAAALAASTL